MYHLLCCIVHRLAYNKDEKADLLILENIRPLNQRKEFFERLTRFGFFDSVRYVPEQNFKLSKGMAITEESSEEDIKTVVGNICTTFENWFKGDMRNYREIYVASDISSCGVYLNGNNIPYNYFEDASGMLSQLDRYLSITGSHNKTNFIVNRYVGGAGRSKNVKTKIGDLKHQQKGYYDEKAVDFSVYDTLKNVIPDKVDAILEFFGDKSSSLELDDKSCLLLTQDLNTLKIKDIDLQELTLTTIVDYICPDCKLIIKPHPKDRWQNYRRIFPNSVLLERAEPAELLPFALGSKVDIAITESSTSINGVDNFARRAYSFTTEIEYKRENTDYFYIITEVLKTLEISFGVTAENINEVQISVFLDNADIAQGGREVLIDAGESASDNTAYKLVFLPFSSNKESEFTLTASYIPHKQSLMPRKKIEIPVFCHDEKYINKLECLSFTRSLKYTKADVEITVHKNNGG